MAQLRKTLARLLNTTEGCRIDLADTEEKGLTAQTVGTVLDNHWGDEIRQSALMFERQEIIVITHRETLHGNVVHERYNLADLIALARLAVIPEEVS